MGNKTLESVAAAFQEWRARRSSSAESIPENLWTMAVGLYPQYKRSKICQQLRLSGSQLKQRIEGAHVRLVDSGFVLASRNEVEVFSKQSSKVQLTLQGEARSLTLCVDVPTLSQILPHLGALL